MKKKNEWEMPFTTSLHIHSKYVVSSQLCNIRSYNPLFSVFFFVFHLLFYFLSLFAFAKPFFFRWKSVFRLKKCSKKMLYPILYLLAACRCKHEKCVIYEIRVSGFSTNFIIISNYLFAHTLYYMFKNLIKKNLDRNLHLKSISLTTKV